MGEYLHVATDVRQMVLRIAPANTASIRMAEKAGFTFLGVFDEPEGSLARYVRELR
jgi:RimJ/RimL family protein N-acetyltransferase